MRDHIRLFVNGNRHDVSGDDAFLTLSDFLRLRLRLPGTKIVCSEGDCGSCTVLVGRPVDGRLVYKSIDSCIRFVFQLDGVHVVTVEGISAGAELNSVQTAMVDCHGSQCGFCTPGFVMAMTGLLNDQENLSTEQWRTGLTGNLCRCTGYTPILEAARKAQAQQPPALSKSYDETDMLESAKESRNESIEISSDNGKHKQRVFCPANLDEALQLLGQHPDAKIVAGATDIGVQFNKGHIQPQRWINLNRVRELTGVCVKNNSIIAGAGATWAEIEAIARDTIPEFENVISVFGSPQIRQVGTIGGNLINASPIADSIPLLYVCGAQLELASTDGTRTVEINAFYKGYKEFDLRPGELLTRITLPLPPANSMLRLYKVSRRRDLDISSFTAAILIECEATSNGSVETISTAKIAYGAVGPTVLRLPNTERFLTGRMLTEETMLEAGDLAVEEITPITDVRGGRDYRLNLARNVLMKFYFETQKDRVVSI